MPVTCSCCDQIFGGTFSSTVFRVDDIVGGQADHLRQRIVRESTYGLAVRTPKLSAMRTVTARQASILRLTAAAAVSIAMIWPQDAAAVLVAVMSMTFVMGMLFRVMVGRAGRMLPDQKPEQVKIADDHLPSYSVLVPLFREANMVPALISALRALDYPSEKLQVILILEEADRETLEAVGRVPFANFHTLTVPEGKPRTKPRACNYALHFATGEYLVIYDAEDRPEPGQLRQAVERFRQEPDRIACLQARLAIHNSDENWITRMFALDYSVWFDLLLPGLDRLKLPIPLGGTSNHFRTAALRRAGAWDPFNVTEDADLGMRLARSGYRVSMLDSVTYEEAPNRIGSWLRQRTRWLKGYMQTVLVHSRATPDLSSRREWRTRLGMQAFLGGAVLSALANPVLWFVFLMSFPAMGNRESSDILGLFAGISGLGLLAANMMLAFLAVSSRSRAGNPIYIALSFVVYWALISVAAYRALCHLLLRPHHWEKTPHGGYSPAEAMVLCAQDM